MLGLAQRVECLTRTIGTVGEDLKSRFFDGQEFDPGRPIGGVGRGEGSGGDQSGLGLNGNCLLYTSRCV